MLALSKDQPTKGRAGTQLAEDGWAYHTPDMKHRFSWNYKAEFQKAQTTSEPSKFDILHFMQHTMWYIYIFSVRLQHLSSTSAESWMKWNPGISQVRIWTSVYLAKTFFPQSHMLAATLYLTKYRIYTTLCNPSERSPRMIRERYLQCSPWHSMHPEAVSVKQREIQVVEIKVPSRPCFSKIQNAWVELLYHDGALHDYLQHLLSNPSHHPQITDKFQAGLQCFAVCADQELHFHRDHLEKQAQ